MYRGLDWRLDLFHVCQKELCTTASSVKKKDSRCWLRILRHYYIDFFYHGRASLVVRVFDCRVGFHRFNPQGRSNSRSLKITKKWRYCPCPVNDKTLYGSDDHIDMAVQHETKKWVLSQYSPVKYIDTQRECFFICLSERRKDQKAELLARQYLEEEQRRKEEQQRKEFEDKEEMRQMLLEQMERKAAEEASNNLRVISVV